MRESLEGESQLNAKLKINALHSSVCGLVGAQDYLNDKSGICISLGTIGKG